MVQKKTLCILTEEGTEENKAKLAKCLKLVNLVIKQWEFNVLFLQLSVIWNYFKIKFKIHFLWSHYLYDLPYLCLICWYWITGAKKLQGVGSCTGTETGSISGRGLCSSSPAHSSVRTFLLVLPDTSYSLYCLLCISKVCCCLVAKSCPNSFATPRITARQAPMSMGFPFPSPADLPNTGIEPVSLALAGGLFYHWVTRKPYESLR